MRESWKRSCPHLSKYSAKTSLMSSLSILLIAETYGLMKSLTTITANSSSRTDSRKKDMKKTSTLTGTRSQRKEKQNKAQLPINRNKQKIKSKFR